MDNKYELFLCNDAVINVRNQEEFNQFTSFMETLGLKSISHIQRIARKYGFEKGFCYNGGVKCREPEDVCFEYQLGKGFTCGSIQDYQNSNYNNYTICDLDDIRDATDYAIKIDNIVIDKPKNTVPMYVRFNTEEKFKSFYRIDVIEERIEDITNYAPVPGFYDLRDFELPEDRFKELWKTQLYLKTYQDNKIFANTIPSLWERLKKLSGEYQSELLSYPQKNEKSNKIDFDLEKEE